MTSKFTFDKIIEQRYKICFIFFVLMVIMQFHGISISQWDTYIVQNNPSQYYGNLRAITSDVWGVVIPEIISQADNGFPLYNYELASNGMNAMLAHIPAADISMIAGLPVFWGYLLFGIHFGIAWFYWFRIIGLFLSGFEILRYLTKNNRVSFVGALLISCSPIVLWWGGHILPESILYGQMMIASGILYFEKYDNLKYKIIAICIAISSTTGFVITLYPAIQVSFGLVVLIFAAFIIKQNINKIKISRVDIILLMVMIVSIIFFVARIFFLSRDSISLMLSTAFPGERIEQGGTGYGLHVFYSVFQIFLPFLQAVSTNNCEASQFICLWLVVLFGMPLYLNRVYKVTELSDRKNIIVALYIYFCLCMLWLTYRFPVWFAKITLFSNVTNNRLLWTLGVLSIYLACVIIADKYVKISKVESICLSVLCCGVLLLSIQRGNEYNIYLNEVPMGYIIGIVFLFILSYSVLSKKKKLFAVISCLFVIINIIAINPVCKGVHAVTEKDLYEYIHNLSMKEPEANWLYAEGYPYGNYLSACGVKSLNATNYYMDIDKWQKIDPSGEYKNLYNRYCQVSVKLGTKTKFELLSPDHLSLTLTDEDIINLDCQYIVSNSDISAYFPELLEQLNDINGIRIYKVNDAYRTRVYSIRNANDVNLSPAQPLRTGIEYEQKFVAKSETINGIDILFGTYARTNYSDIEITINGENGVIFNASYDLSNLIDNAIASFPLEDIPVTEGEEYTITFQPIEDSDNDFITIYQSLDTGDYAINIYGC